MSSKSWLASASRSINPLLSNPPHELPRWQTPSAMTASIIPPPIVPAKANRAVHDLHETTILDKQPEFGSKQQEIEADLQLLLDAQAEGLIHGLQGGPVDDYSSTGSTTPTLHTIRADRNRRTARTFQKRPGLRGARRGIYNQILSLASLKSDELEDVDAEILQDDETLARIDAWESKRVGLQEALQETDSSEDNARVQRLHHEANDLQVDINQVEMQLMEMKAKHRNLLRQATEIENSVQARLASYTSSLRSLEQDVQQFLTLKPGNASANGPINDKPSIWQLPPRKRNLGMAKEFWREQYESRMQQRQTLNQEKSALVDGASTWKEVVVAVQDFENQLRSEMSSSQSYSAWEDPPQQDPAIRLKELLGKMQTLISFLEQKLGSATNRGWNLLIAAIGAEVDALKQGRRILEGVMGVEAEPTVDHDAEADDSPNGHMIRDLDQSFEKTMKLDKHTEAESEEDDEPDPELLFSVQHEDNE